MNRMKGIDRLLRNKLRLVSLASLLAVPLALTLALPRALAYEASTGHAEADRSQVVRSEAAVFFSTADQSVRTTTAPTLAGVMVDPTSGLETDETGDDDTFDVWLTDVPTATVTIDLDSDDPGEGVPSTNMLTFTTLNWDQPQTVTVTGVDDDLVDGDVAYSIVTEAAQSADPAYQDLEVPDVSVTNLDDDTAGFNVDPVNGLITSEDADFDTFEISLTSQPTATVTVDLASDDPGEGTPSPTSVSFNAGDWDQPQTVTVTGVDDDVVDGDVVYHIETAAAASPDPVYDGLDPADVEVTNQDNDSAGITVEPVSGLVTSETAVSDTFDVWLNSEPAASVTINLSSDDPGEGTPFPLSLTFLPANWDQPQTVTVTGVDDDVVDGDVIYHIVTAAAQSADPDYDGLDPADVEVTNQDDDTAGITVDPVSGLVTTEMAGSDTFDVWLNSEPAASVTINLASDDPGEGTPFPLSLTFLPANWDQPQTVTVTGNNDFMDDGDVVYHIETAAAESGDPVYDGLDPADVEVTNQDDDTAGITVDPVSGLVTSEGGGTDTFEVWLDSQPAGAVIIGLSSADPTEGLPSPVSLTFTPGNWSIPKTVTVTGVDDDLDDGDILYWIQTAPATGGDPTYTGMDAADVSVTNLDGDNRPVALDDQYDVDEDQVLSVAAPGVLLNDTDANQDPLLAFLQQGVSHGALNLSPDGSFVYTPTLDFFGQDMFVYVASDGILTDTATVTLNVNPINDPPAAVDDVYPMNEDVPLNVSPPGVLGNDLDVDGDTLNAALVTDVFTGSLSLNPNGSFSYTPASNFNGVVTFTYQTSDGFFTDTATASLTIAPVNDPPVAVDDQYITNATQADPQVIAPPGVLANDIDVDLGDILTAILDQPPVNGDIQLSPSGGFTYTPNLGFNGLDMFSYHVSDGTAESGIAQVEILVDTIPPPPPIWMGPVEDEGILEVGIEYITLTVELDPSATDVAFVEFYRWDAGIQKYVGIGNVFAPPYQWVFHTGVLNIDWNQIFARTYDFAGNVSERRFIWLFRLLPPKAFLPLVPR